MLVEVVIGGGGILVVLLYMQGKVVLTRTGIRKV